ncbi:MAG TPA: DUF3313 family protein [Woeseiaceae bacterium]|nr:DUF3313 family protein [Woeseiaceae bacterium]
MQKISAVAILLLLTGILAAGCATNSADDLPATTTDGLKRVASDKVDAVYWADGASLAGYDAVMILDTPVAFRKNWMRDYNADRTDLSLRVSQEDMDRIKAGLAEAFREQFTKTLEAGGYKVVDEPGESVLLLRPAITDLDVNAPDLDTSTNVRTFTTEAGEMTLYMELYDSATGDKIGEVADREQAIDRSQFQYTNRVTNRAEANRILNKWAKLLVDALDEARSKA